MDESSGLDPWDKLSKAERRVVELLCRGLTNPQIADELYLSRRTIQSHLYNVFKKVGVRSRTELVALAVRAGVDEKLSSADSGTGT